MLRDVAKDRRSLSSSLKCLFNVQCMADNAGAIVGAVAPVVGSAVSALMNAGQNRATRKWNEKMYATQKQDNLDFWNMQNTYNSPVQQMQRFREAGVNPYLATSQASGSAGSVSAPSALPYRPGVPDLDLPQIVNGYQNVRMMNQQLSNAKLQGNVLAAEVLNKSEEARSKQMLNDYMSDRGYVYRRNSERSKTNILEEQYTDWLARNTMNFLGGNGQFPAADGTMYQLNGRSLDLGNQLRQSELTSKGLHQAEQRIINQYRKRTMSGELGDMSAKDIFTLILQGLNVGGGLLGGRK